MKFEFAAAIECNNKNKDVFVFIGIETGIYIAKFDRPNADFFPNVNLETALRSLSNYYTVETTMEFEFGEEDLKPKEGFKDVRCYKCATVRVKQENVWRTLLIEYLDTSRGKIPLHGHNAGECEIYVSADKPFIGKVCRAGEKHEPFTEHTIAVKQLATTTTETRIK